MRSQGSALNDLVLPKHPRNQALCSGKTSRSTIEKDEKEVASTAAGKTH